MSATAFAQKGESRVGLNLNVSPLMEDGVSLTNFGIAAKYQYGVTNHLRLEAAVGYDFKADEVSVFEAGVNAHWLFKIGEKFKIYPIVGVGYANINGYISYDEDDHDWNGAMDNYNKYFAPSTRSYDDDDDDYSESANKFYYNLGAGFEYDITSRISACVEVKWQGMQWFNRLPITIGASYRF